MTTQITVSGASPAVAQSAVQTAVASLPPSVAAAPGVQTATSNVQAVVTAQATGTTGTTTTAQTGQPGTETGTTGNGQPSVPPVTPPPTYVG